MDRARREYLLWLEETTQDLVNQAVVDDFKKPLALASGGSRMILMRAAAGIFNKTRVKICCWS